MAAEDYYDDEEQYDYPDEADVEGPQYEYEQDEPVDGGAGYDAYAGYDDRVAYYEQPAYEEPQYQYQDEAAADDGDWESAYLRAYGGAADPAPRQSRQPRADRGWEDAYLRAYGGDNAYDSRVYAEPARQAEQQIERRPGAPTTWADGSPMDEKAAKQARAYRVGLEQGLDDEGARVLVAVTETEAGLSGTLGDNGQSRGGYQFYEGGQMPAFRTWVGQQGIQGDPNDLVHDIDLATRFAASTYLGNAIRRGQQQGLHGAELATYVQRTGQVSVNPEKTGANYQRLFAQGDRWGEALRHAQPDPQSRAASNARIPPGHYDGDGHDHGVATPYAQQQVDKAGNEWTIAFDFDQPYDNPFNPAIPRHRGVDLQVTGVAQGGMNLPYTPFRSGRVAKITNDPNGGIGIIVDTGDPVARYDRYFHNNAVSVREGDEVVAGQTDLGLIGQTGTQGFPHLHYEVSRGINGDPSGQTIDPRPYISRRPVGPDDGWQQAASRAAKDWADEERRVTGRPKTPAEIAAYARDWADEERRVTGRTLTPEQIRGEMRSLAPPRVMDLQTPYSSGRREQTTGIVIHSTRGNAADPQAEFDWTVRWFGNNPNQVSANAVIGPDGTIAMPRDWDLVTHHAGENNRTSFGIELAQPRPEDPYTDAQYQSLGWLLQQLHGRYNLPIDRQTVRGHEELEQGKRSGKTDPGEQFDWARAIALGSGATAPGNRTAPAAPPYVAPAQPYRPAQRGAAPVAAPVSSYTVAGKPATREQYEAAVADAQDKRAQFEASLPDHTRAAFQEWAGARQAGGQDITLPEFRAHLGRLGAPDPWTEQARRAEQAQAPAPRPAAPAAAAATPAAQTREVPVYKVGDAEVSKEEYDAAVARNEQARAEKAEFDAAADREQAAIDAYGEAVQRWRALAASGEVELENLGPQPSAPETPHLNIRLQGRSPEGRAASTARFTRQIEEIRQQHGVSLPASAYNEGTPPELASAIEDAAAIRSNQQGAADAARLQAREAYDRDVRLLELSRQAGMQETSEAILPNRPGGWLDTPTGPVRAPAPAAQVAARQAAERAAAGPEPELPRSFSEQVRAASGGAQLEQIAAEFPSWQHGVAARTQYGAANQIAESAAFVGDLVDRAIGRAAPPEPGSYREGVRATSGGAAFDAARTAVADSGQWLSQYGAEVRAFSEERARQEQEAGTDVVRPPDRPFNPYNPAHLASMTIESAPILLEGMMAGTAAATIGAMAAVPAAGAALIGGLASGATMFTAEGGQAYDAALAQGVDRDRALQIGVVVGTVNAALEEYGPLKWLPDSVKKPIINRVTSPLVSDVGVKWLAHGLAGGTEEALEEAAQGIFSNAAQSSYDGQQSLLDGIRDQMIGGFIPGLLLGSTGQAIRHASGAEAADQARERARSELEAAIALSGPGLQERYDARGSGREAFPSFVPIEGTPAPFEILAQQGTRIEVTDPNWRQFVVRQETPDGQQRAFTVSMTPQGGTVHRDYNGEQAVTPNLKSETDLENAIGGYEALTRYLAEKGAISDESTGGLIASYRTHVEQAMQRANEGIEGTARPYVMPHTAQEIAAGGGRIAGASSGGPYGIRAPTTWTDAGVLPGTDVALIAGDHIPTEHVEAIRQDRAAQAIAAAVSEGVDRADRRAQDLGILQDGGRRRVAAALWATGAVAMNDNRYGTDARGETITARDRMGRATGSGGYTFDQGQMMWEALLRLQRADAVGPQGQALFMTDGSRATWGDVYPSEVRPGMPSARLLDHPLFPQFATEVVLEQIGHEPAHDAQEHHWSAHENLTRAFFNGMRGEGTALLPIVRELHRSGALEDLTLKYSQLLGASSLSEGWKDDGAEFARDILAQRARRNGRADGAAPGGVPGEVGAGGRPGAGAVLPAVGRARRGGPATRAGAGAAAVAGQPAAAATDGIPDLAPPTAAPTTFVTARGSTYEVHEDGTTTRDKAAREDVGHAGDFGPKPRSEATYFLTPENARRLAPPQGTTRLIDHGDGTLSMATRNSNGQWGIAPSQRNVPYETGPREGLTPLEVWRRGQVGGLPAYRVTHFGNPITSVSRAAEPGAVPSPMIGEVPPPPPIGPPGIVRADERGEPPMRFAMPGQAVLPRDANAPDAIPSPAAAFAGPPLLSDEDAIDRGWVGIPDPRLPVEDRVDLHNRLVQTPFINYQELRAILGERPQDLQQVVAFMLDQRAKVVEGRLLPSDVAKAYLMTVSSQGQGAVSAELVQAKTGLTLPDHFLTPNAQGVRQVRPEDAAAAWIASPNGQRALAALDRGEFDAAAWGEAAGIRAAFSDDRINNLNVMGTRPARLGQLTMRDVPRLTAELNRVGDDPRALSAAVGRLNGIKRQKVGFVQHLLGFGEVPTIDARVINTWITGQGEIRGMENETAQIARMINQHHGMSRTMALTIVRIVAGYNRLRRNGFAPDIPGQVYNAVLHGWLWSKVKGLDRMFGPIHEAQAAPVRDPGGRHVPLRPRGALPDRKSAYRVIDGKLTFTRGGISSEVTDPGRVRELYGEDGEDGLDGAATAGGIRDGGLEGDDALAARDESFLADEAMNADDALDMVYGPGRDRAPGWAARRWQAEGAPTMFDDAGPSAMVSQPASLLLPVAARAAWPAGFEEALGNSQERDGPFAFQPPRLVPGVGLVLPAAARGQGAYDMDRRAPRGVVYYRLWRGYGRSMYEGALAANRVGWDPSGGPSGRVQGEHVMRNPLIYWGGSLLADHARQLAMVMGEDPAMADFYVEAVVDQLGQLGPLVGNVASLMTSLGMGDPSQAPLLVHASRGEVGYSRGGLADLIITHMLGFEGRARGFDGVVSWNNVVPYGQPVAPRLTEGASFVEYSNPGKRGAAALEPGMWGGRVPPDLARRWRLLASPQRDTDAFQDRLDRLDERLSADPTASGKTGYRVEDGRLVYPLDRPAFGDTGYAIIDGMPVFTGLTEEQQRTYEIEDGRPVYRGAQQPESWGEGFEWQDAEPDEETAAPPSAMIGLVPELPDPASLRGRNLPPDHVMRGGLGVPDPGYEPETPEANVEHGLLTAAYEQGTATPNVSAEEMRALAPEMPDPTVPPQIPSLDPRTGQQKINSKNQPVFTDTWHGRPRSMADLRLAIEVGLPHRRWYTDFGTWARTQVGAPNLNEFRVLFGITSSRTPVNNNLTNAIALMRWARELAAEGDGSGLYDQDAWQAKKDAERYPAWDDKLGAPKMDPKTGAVQQNKFAITNEQMLKKVVDGYRDGLVINGANAKTASYSGNVLAGALTAYDPNSTIDTWMGQLIGWGNDRFANDDGAYRVGHAIFNWLAREQGLNPNEAQAAGWFTIKTLTEAAPDLRKRLDDGSMTLTEGIREGQRRGIFGQVRGDLDDVLQQPAIQEQLAKLQEALDPTTVGPGKAGQMEMVYPGDTRQNVPYGRRPISNEQVAVERGSAVGQAPTVTLPVTGRDVGIDADGRIPELTIPHLVYEHGGGLTVALPGGNFNAARYAAALLGRKAGVDEALVYQPSSRAANVGALRVFDASGQMDDEAMLAVSARLQADGVPFVVSPRADAVVIPLTGDPVSVATDVVQSLQSLGIESLEVEGVGADVERIDQSSYTGVLEELGRVYGPGGLAGVSRAGDDPVAEDDASGAGPPRPGGARPDGVGPSAMAGLPPGEGIPPERRRMMAEAAASDHVTYGGSTINFRRGNLAGQQNYAVSIYPERSAVLAEPPAPEWLEAYIAENEDLLMDPRNSLGTWHDADDSGEHYIDVSVNLPDRAEAEGLGRRYNQKAIYDLASLEPIDTGGTGDPIAGLPPETERLGHLETPDDAAEVLAPPRHYGRGVGEPADQGRAGPPDAYPGGGAVEGADGRAGDALQAEDPSRPEGQARQDGLGPEGAPSAMAGSIPTGYLETVAANTAARRALVQNSPTLLAQAAESTARLQDAMARAIDDDPLIGPGDQRVVDGFARFYTSAVIGLAANDQERLDTVGLTFEQARTERERALDLLSSGPDGDDGLTALYDAEAAWATLYPTDDPEAPPPSAMTGLAPGATREPFYSRLAQVASGLPDETPPTLTEASEPKIVRRAAQAKGAVPPANSPLVVDEQGNWVRPGDAGGAVRVGAGDRVLQQLEAAGAKPDEIAWTGLKEWLVSRGDAPVTRDEVVDYLDQRRIVVTETVHEMPAPERDTRNFAAYAEEEHGYTDAQIDAAWNTDDPVMLEWNARQQAAHQDRVSAARRLPRYQQYVLPGGGREYRELLLTLPLTETGQDRVRVEAQPDDTYRVAEYGARGDFAAWVSGHYRSRDGAVAARERYLAENWDETPGQPPYKSVHWDERNVLVHVRFNERADADGKRVLFIEEIQSDWHQDAAKKGYAGPGPMTYTVFNRRSGNVAQTFATQPEAERYVQTLYDVIPEAERNLEIRSDRTPVEGVPDAPFKTQAQWSRLALRRMIRWAAEHGYERLGWTTGEQQSKRYSLGNDIRTLVYNPDTHRLRAHPRRHEGGPIEREGVKPDDLGDFVGQEHAALLLARPRNNDGNHVLSGLENLNLEGTGMVRFYDQRLVEVATELGEPWGVAPTSTVVAKGDAGGSYAEAGWMAENTETGWASDDVFATRAEAEAYAAEQNELDAPGWVVSPTGHEVHAMDIPAQMRRSALEVGQPLFMTGLTPQQPTTDPFYSRLEQAAADLPDETAPILTEASEPKIVRRAAQARGAVPPQNSPLTVDEQGNWVRAAEPGGAVRTSAGDQVLQRLEAAGAKPDEMTWTGLKDWLAARGDAPVTRDEVMAFLARNRVRITETMRGGPGAPSTDPDDLLLTVESDDETWPVGDDEPSRSRIYSVRVPGADAEATYEARQVPGQDDAWEIFDGDGEWVDAADGLTIAEVLIRDRASELLGESVEDQGVRWRGDQYNLPGGEEPRELILQWPGRPVDPTGWTAEREPGRGTPGGYGVYRVTDARGEPLATFSAYNPEEAIERVVQDRTDRPLFTHEAHWDELPNPIVHVRFNTRIGPDDERILFIEELQSDWHQEGGEKGYATPGRPLTEEEEAREADLRKQAAALKAEESEILAAAGDRVGAQFWSAAARNARTPEERARNQELGRQLTDLDAELAQLEETNRGHAGPPEAPWGGAQNWSRLGLRRMIRYAAENGYDRIAWTMGDQQNERYRLDRHFSRIAWDEEHGLLSAYAPDGAQSVAQTGVTRDTLASYLGDDLAARTAEAEPNLQGIRVVAGDDLRAGGQGMRRFYDNTLVRVATELGEPWGAAPTTMRINAAPADPLEQVPWGATEEGTEVHVMDIPPAMQQSALDVGQPSFMAGLTPEEPSGDSFYSRRRRPIPPRAEEPQSLWDQGVDPEDELDPNYLAALDAQGAAWEIDNPDGLPRTDGPEQIPLVLPMPERPDDDPALGPALPGGAVAGIPTLAPPGPREPDLTQFPEWAQGVLEVGALMDPDDPRFPGTPAQAADVLRTILDGPQGRSLNGAEVDALAGAILRQYWLLQKAIAAAGKPGASPWAAAQAIEQATRYAALRALATQPRERWGALEGIWKKAPISQGEGKDLEEFLQARQAAQTAGDTEAEDRFRREGLRRAAAIVEEGKPRWSLRRPGRGPKLATDEGTLRGYAQAAAQATRGASPTRMAETVAQPDLSISPTEFLVAARYNNMLLGPRGILVDYLTNTGMLFGKLMADPFLPEAGGASVRARFGIARAEYAALKRALPLAIRSMSQQLSEGVTDAEADVSAAPRTISGRLRERARIARDEGTVRGRLRGAGLTAAELGAVDFAELAGRLKGMADTGIKEFSYTAELVRQAAVLAWRQGQEAGFEVDSEVWHRRVADILVGKHLDPDPKVNIRMYLEMQRNAVREAERTVFQGKMGTVGNKMESIQRHPLGQWVLPFLRTLYHIRGWAVDLSPVGPLVTATDVARGAAHRGLMKSERGQRLLGATRNGLGFLGGPYAQAWKGDQVGPAVADLDRRMMANMVGTVGFMYLVGMAFEGLLSASGPPDDPIVFLDDELPNIQATQLRKTLRASGWRPYSMKIPWVDGKEYWVEYKNWGPLGYLLGAAAVIGETYRYGVKAPRDPHGRSDWRLVAAGEGLYDLAAQADADTYRTAARRFAGTMADLSYVGGLVELLQMGQNAYQYSVAPETESPSEKIKRQRAEAAQMGRWAAWTISAVTPAGALLRTIAQSQDPYSRTTEYGDIRESFAYGIPDLGPVDALAPPVGLPDLLRDKWGSPTGRRQGLPVEIDVMGRPIANEYAGAYGWLPFRATAVDMSSEAVNTLIDAGVGAATPPREMYYKPANGGDAMLVLLPESIRQDIAKDMGAANDARVRKEMAAVPPEQRAADPAAWSDRLKAAMKETYFEGVKAAEQKAEVKAALAELVKDSSRTRPFDSKKEKDALLHSGEAPTDGAAPASGGAPGPSAPGSATAPAPGGASRSQAELDAARERARRGAGATPAPAPAGTPVPAAPPATPAPARAGTPAPAATPTPAPAQGPRSQAELDAARDRARRGAAPVR